ncbi:MAG: zinc-ribbon domain containing protein [Rubrivivax sp.]|nr:zinc-ribbon domain containing protein [Rubrivivax sp.]
MKVPADPYADFVPHPRFGRGPRRTGLDPANTPDGSVFLHWHSGPEVRVPGTAIAANTTDQCQATVPVTHYFDARRVCRQCARPFLFFAEEQKHWYEELKFPLEADCLECVPCRKAEQRLQAAQRRYASLLGHPQRSVAETLELVECGVFLVEAGVFSKKSLPKLLGLLKAVGAAPGSAHHEQALVLRARVVAAEVR